MKVKKLFLVIVLMVTTCMLVVKSNMDTYDRVVEATVNVTLASGEEIEVLVRQGIQLYGEDDGSFPFLLKIDWLDDDQIYDGAVIN